jgi:hypothetical protein
LVITLEHFVSKNVHDHHRNLSFKNESHIW